MGVHTLISGDGDEGLSRAEARQFDDIVFSSMIGSLAVHQSEESLVPSLNTIRTIPLDTVVALELLRKVS